MTETLSSAVSPVVQTDHLSKWYGRVIGRNDVSVAVAPGVVDHATLPPT